MPKHFNIRSFSLPGILAALLGGCAGQPIATAPHVDLQRFMGDWYVIANIPTFIEKNAYGPVESYRLDTDGSIATTFSFREGGFDGPLKTYRPRGHVLDRQTNAVWGMQFIWPIKADYRILYVADDYSLTVVGRERRDSVWIMARTPHIPDSDYRRMVALAVAQGYDEEKIRKPPQRAPH